MSSSSCDTCGWLAALGGMLTFGSFGVPIKSRVAQTLDIDPLVMQTYKTSMCFLTSWLILLSGEEISFTPWGIVSGIFWVPAGIATVFAIKNAGLAIAIGMGSSFNVLVGFTWGIFIFDEHVHSRLDSCLAVGCMMIGILGMAYYSVPSDCPLDDIEGDRDGMLENGHEYHRLDCQDVDDPEHSSSDRPLDANHCVEEDAAWMTGPTDPSPEALLPISRDDDDEGDDLDQTMSSSHIMCLGMVWSRRTLGILSAMFSGIYGGSLMVPMKWVPTNAKGSHYVISFAVGASTVNLTLWIIRTLYLSVRSGSLTEGYNALPPMYLKQMWKYGTACGLLWSIGNFCSILAVEFLGEGVGYSLVQSSLLVSGLWGIFFFGEVKGCATISKWFLSAAITLLGILILSYEHHKK